MKKILYFVLIFTISGVYSQKPLSISDREAQMDRQQILVEKGQTLNDFLPGFYTKTEQTDLDPGVAPEGDYMLRSAFTTDGEKVIVCTGGTNNVTVFDWATMETEAVIEVGEYPCDVAVTDDYAVVPCIFGDEIYVIDLDDYSIAAVFATSAEVQPVVAKVSPDGQYAYVASDIDDGLVVIDLSNLSVVNSFGNFPIGLISYSWVSTGGRSRFKFTQFEVSPDGNHLIVGNSDNEV